MAHKNFIYKSLPKYLSAILFLSLIVINTIKSQLPKTLNFHSIDNTNGLPHNFVNDIEVDSLGFIWIATNDGLVRYDSQQKMKIFKKGDLGLGSSNIRSLYSGGNNELWIGTRFGGLTQFNYNDNYLKNYSTQGAEGKTLSNDEILSILERGQNEIWVGTENGLNVLDTETGNIHQFLKNDSDPFSIQAKAILDIYKDKESRTWIGTWGGSMYLYLKSPSDNIAEGKFRKFTISDHLGSKNAWKIFQDSKDRYWIATHSGGLYLMQLPASASDQIDQQDWEPIFHQFINDPERLDAISSDYIQDVAEDADGNIWVGSVHGLNLINSSDLSKISGDDYSNEKINLGFKRQYYNPSRKGSLNNNNITRIFRDNQNLMWLGTITGMNQYNWYINQFDIFNLTNNLKNDQNKFELINTILINNDSVAILASDINGIIEYDMLKHEIIDKPKFDLLELHKRVTVIYDNGNNEIYAGTTKGLVNVNLETRALKKYPLAELVSSNDPNIYISCILKDSKGRVWCGTENGLFLFDEKTDKFTLFNDDENSDKNISDNSITKIYEDSNANIWISTFNGLNLLVEKESYTFKKFKKEFVEYNESIPSNQITSIGEYNDQVYFGTQNGLFAYAHADQSFRLVKTSDKIYSFQSFEITSKGVLWGSTSEGVISLNLINNESKLYGKNDGIGDISFRINSSFIDKNEDLYFGGIKGFMKIKASTLKKNISPPNIYITDIESINSKETKKYSGTQLEEIILEPDNFYLSIDFTSLNYNQSQYNKYAYKLEGFGDDEWKYVQANQSALYTNLKHGNYVFRVKGSNNEGVWNEEGTSIKIKVKAKLIEKIWFQVLSALLLLGLVYFLFTLYTRSIKKRNLFLQDYNQKLNNQIAITKEAQLGLVEKEKNMRILLSKLDESNKELMRSNKDLEQFAYVASHDMKEPLRTVGTFTNLLSRKYFEQLDSNGKEYIDFITEGVDRMSALINSLLTYSQVGKKNVHFQINSIENLITDKVKDLSKLIEDKDVDIIIENMPKVFCVGDQIGMVFYNLILNGIKFNKSEGPTITIQSKEENDRWIFSVTDNGIGIAKEYQEQIFEIFKRLHSREEYEGTGIGLALCNKIIHRHNGSIWLESEPGKGTCFYFTISKNIHDVEPESESIDSSVLEKEVQEILRA